MSLCPKCNNEMSNSFRDPHRGVYDTDIFDKDVIICLECLVKLKPDNPYVKAQKMFNDAVIESYNQKEA